MTVIGTIVAGFLLGVLIIGFALAVVVGIGVRIVKGLFGWLVGLE
jgi:hypothetical protein